MLAPRLSHALAAVRGPSPPQAVEVDLNGCRFLEPWCLVALACVLQAYHQRGARVVVCPVAHNQQLHRYLTNIGFYTHWTPGHDRSIYAPAHIQTTLNLWQVTPEMIDYYAMEARQYYARHFFPERSLDALSVCLVEQFNNISNHARSEVGGYCLTQFYPKKNRLVTSVCDLGVGIPAALNAYWTTHGHEALPETDALRAALRHRVTSKTTPQNQGRGLHTLCLNAGTLRGSIRFHSTFAAYYQAPQPLPHPAPTGVHWATSDAFPGTLITLELDVTALPAAEVEVLDTDFDF